MTCRRSTRVAALLGVLALVGAACSKTKQVESAPSASVTPTESMSKSESMMASESMMPMQPDAKNWHAAFVSPASGVLVSANSITVRVSWTGFTPSCDWAGKDDKPGIGHYHILLDKALVNMFCTPTATISLQNVKPGAHTIEVLPTQDDHQEIEHNGQTISFTYRPSTPLQTITGATFPDKPQIKILSPADGATLSGAFDVKVQITNYHSNCDLLGKPDVPGYGHWHVNVDSMSGPMMGMGTMLGMACTDTFHGSTLGLQAGTTHTLFALLTDNGHAPLNIFDKITFKVG